jgi:dTDP-4-amino-4,6-dideoxygalactose transaminase
MIFTSLSPNTEPDDVILALKMRLSRASWPDESARTELERMMASHLIQGDLSPTTFAFDSGRTSLFAILSTLGLGSSDEVLIQSYTCVAVPEPILWVGARPVYVDCLQDLTMDPQDLERKISHNSKVLIIQHTFGLPAKIDELLAIAKKHNLFVIEDCAHTLGAEYRAQKVGTFGDASFFSFGRDKVLSSVFGGVLAVSDNAIAEKVRVIYNSFPEPTAAWVKQQLNHPLIFSVAKPLYSLLGLGKIIIEGSKRLKLFSKAVEDVELSGGRPSFAFKKMSPTLALLALNQFAKLERYNQHRQTLAKIYDEALAGFPVTIPPQESARSSIYLRYTLLIKNPSKLAVYLRKHGIMAGDWYTESIAPKRVDYKKIHYHEDVCPTAEQLSHQSINLPTTIQTSEEQARRIASLCKEYFTNER